MQNYLYKDRRYELCDQLFDSIVVLKNADEILRNGRDMTFPFRADSNFWYLAGFPEPSAILVMVVLYHKPKCILFCEGTRNFNDAAFQGQVIGTERAVNEYYFDEAYTLDQFESKMLEYVRANDKFYYLFDEKPDFVAKLHTLVGDSRRGVHRKSNPPHTSMMDLEPTLSEMRLHKNMEEINLLREACEISASAISHAMQVCKHGMFEYQLEAEILSVHRKMGAGRMPAYTTIVAGGNHATTLHYIENNGVLMNGQFVLVDAGAEYHHYSGDVTRAWPVNGKFTSAQRAIYEIVLDAQKQAIAEVFVGSSIDAIHQVAVRVITEGLVRLGLLAGNVDKLIAIGNDPTNPPEASFKRFFMHRTSHWLGLDTHDVGEYYNEDGTSRTLEEGMVLTVEPGIYIPNAPDILELFRGISIRIEDDLLVTEPGNEVLSRNVPKEINEIEALMKK